MHILSRLLLGLPQIARRKPAPRNLQRSNLEDPLERAQLYAKRARGYAFMAWLFAFIAIFSTIMTWVYDK